MYMLSNFSVTFIEVLKDDNQASLPVEPSVTSGDFLHGFYLSDAGRGGQEARRRRRRRSGICCEILFSASF